MATLAPPNSSGRTRNLNCSDFAIQRQAQAALNAEPGRSHGSNGDGNGVGCEFLHEIDRNTCSALPKYYLDKPNYRKLPVCHRFLLAHPYQQYGFGRNKPQF